MTLSKKLIDAMANAIVRCEAHACAPEVPFTKYRLQAVTKLKVLRDGIVDGSVREVPYDILETNCLFPISTGLPIFRLWEAMQDLVEWLGSDTPDVHEEHLIREFSRIAARGSTRETIVFVPNRITPAARRAILSQPNRGMNCNGRSPVLTISHSGAAIPMTVPENVRFNEERQIWDVVRD